LGAKTIQMEYGHVRRYCKEHGTSSLVSEMKYRIGEPIGNDAAVCLLELCEAVVLNEQCLDSLIKFLKADSYCPFSLNLENIEVLSELLIACKFLFRSVHRDQIRNSRDWSILVLISNTSTGNLHKLALETLISFHNFNESTALKIIEDDDLAVSYAEPVACYPGQGSIALESDIRLKSRLVPTFTTCSNMTMMHLALQSVSPILIQGRSGSGKSLLVKELARMQGKLDTLVELQLDDQMDSKTLLGTYVCTDIPGEFLWQPGALTQAVTSGCWVLIEDIDRVNFEILAALIPLLETRTMLVPNRDQVLVAAPGFQLFATRRGQSKNSSFDSHWTLVQLEPLSKDELGEIAVSKNPSLNTPLRNLMLNTFCALDPNNHQEDVLQCPVDPRRAIPGRTISERDLFKWLGRVEALVTLHSEMRKDGGIFMTEQEREDVLVEGLDCFAAGMPSTETRITFAKWMARSWMLPEERVVYRMTSYKPIVTSQKDELRVGRVVLSVGISQNDSSIAESGVSMRLLEQLAASVKMNEPVLLVGETGVGKTSMIQYLSKLMNKTMIVQNMHVQSDSTELLGGYKPIQLVHLARPIYQRFLQLFCSLFSESANEKFLVTVSGAFDESNWKKVAKALLASCKMARTKLEKRKENGKRRKMNEDQDWSEFEDSVTRFDSQRKRVESSFAFAFEEGALVRAIRQGDWVLLDEINLASSETLERLTGLLDTGTLALTERGDLGKVYRHPEFRIFAAMNPATDYGKKDLPPALRCRFTELYVDEVEDPMDLQLVAESYLKDVPEAPVMEIVTFYLAARSKSKAQLLLDGSNLPPRYSLRTLCRSLDTCRRFLTRGFGLHRSLYESFLMTFATVLNSKSYETMRKMLNKAFVSDTTKKSLDKAPKCPKGEDAILCDKFWVPKGPRLCRPIRQPGDAHDELRASRWKMEDQEAEAVISNFVETASVTLNVQFLARAIAAHKYPILLQGPTSSGKTSMVAYLAAQTGHKCVRVNNHEHTDLQEYMGSYVSDSRGNLEYKEGVLVEAVRQGHWIVLDELNLAPSEVLEALNRLLDDNRELFIPETQEVIKPHPSFMLFATQNPPGLYGGRKMLSRAFRNRFLEMHVGEIPSNELETILNKRTQLAPPFCKVLVNVMNELQMHRQQSRLFAGKEGFITPRDLLRWAGRHPTTYEELAVDGFRLLGDRVRVARDKLVVQSVIEKHCKQKLSDDLLYPHDIVCNHNSEIVWTSAMRRLYSLVQKCTEFEEPVLLVGETGCGKTTVCQMLANDKGIRLEILNCHQNTDTADILGSLRPVRGKKQLMHHLWTELKKLSDLEVTEDATIDDIDVVVRDYKGEEDLSLVKDLLKQCRALFEWQDGPLVNAIRKGEMFLLDEMSLAEDAVLERLNSILEPSRTIFLAERGGDEVEEIKAHAEFRILSTMNPGGDYGKRELSPALRNRFTEIWIPAVTSQEDIEQIVAKHLVLTTDIFKSKLVEFFLWFNNVAQGDHPLIVLSLRDAISWASFIQVATQRNISQWHAYVHGAGLIILDGIGLGSGISLDTCLKLRTRAYSFLLEQVHDYTQFAGDALIQQGLGATTVTLSEVNTTQEKFGIDPFYIDMGPVQVSHSTDYALEAPTTSLNLIRVLRALQLPRPILLEGSPGVGKTSLISALASRSGHRLVRINLSEQTDFADLIGSDIPANAASDEASKGSAKFVWSDGIFLSALKRGDWVLLDELNLASQSVLEGLNSCLDHRGTVYVPELNETFACPPSFRVFAAQNPVQQGGGRKGLPKSFLNRFTKVFVDSLTEADYLFILKQVYPMLHKDGLIEQVVDFNIKISDDIVVKRLYGRNGAPWEFNLRDIFRFCDLIKTDEIGVQVGVSLVYLDRLRKQEDREAMQKRFEECFHRELNERRVDLRLSPTHLYVGHVKLSRDASGEAKPTPFIPRSCLTVMEHVSKCIQQAWPVLLIGSSGCGKSTVLHSIAQLCNRQLHQFAITSSTDSTELLGCFEQVDANRSQRQFATEYNQLYEDVSRCLMIHFRDSNELLELERSRHMDIEHSIEALEAAGMVAGDVFMKRLAHLVKLKDQQYVTGAFEWVDGTLVRAMERGDWVVLDNANLCNPTVLDRLNAVLETGGELLINECGMVNGQARVLRPHENFRIFLVADPQYGEVSRAMRNRCVEISMLEPQWDEMQNSGDCARLLAFHGVSSQSDTMIETLSQIHQTDTGNRSLVTPRNVVKWAKMFKSCREYFENEQDAFQRSFQLTFHLDVAAAQLIPCETTANLVVDSSATWSLSSVLPAVKRGDIAAASLEVLDAISDRNRNVLLSVLGETYPLDFSHPLFDAEFSDLPYQSHDPLLTSPMHELRGRFAGLLMRIRVRQFEESNKILNDQETSMIMLSVRCNNGTVSKMEVGEKSIVMLAPYLQAVDQFVLAVLSTRTELNDELLVALRRTFLLRVFTWDMSHETKLQSNIPGPIMDALTSRISILVRWIAKCIVQIAGDDEHWGAMRQMMIRMDDALGAKSSRCITLISMNSSSVNLQRKLWKASGWQKPMKSEQMFDLMQRATKLSGLTSMPNGSSLVELVEKSSAAFMLSAKDKHSIMEGLSMLKWANHSLISSSNHTTELEACAVVSKLLESIETFVETQQTLVAEEQVPLDSWCNTYNNDNELYTASLTWCLVQLRPMMDQWASHTQAGLLVCSTTKAMLGYMLELTSNSPKAIADFQDLVWRRDANQSFNSCSSLMSYYASMWSATFNDKNSVDHVSTGHSDRALDKTIVHHTVHSVNDWPLESRGPIRLMQDMTSVMVFRLTRGTALGLDAKQPRDASVYPYGAPICIRDRNVKLAQLEMCLHHLMHQPNQQLDWVADDTKMLGQALEETLHVVFGLEFNHQIENHLLVQLDDVSELQKMLVSCPFEEVPCGQLLRQVSDVLLDRNVAPLERIGKLWCFLSMFRLISLVPVSAVDPFIKPATELGFVETSVQTVKSHLVAKHVNDKESGLGVGPCEHSQHSVHSYTSRLRCLQDRLKILQESIVFRPSHSQFSEFHSILTDFVSSLGSMDRVSSIMEVLSTNDGVAQEAMWQEVAEQLCLQLRGQFAGYDDIVEPCVLAIYQLKHGLRLLLAAKQHALEDEQVIYDAQRVLASYPSTRVCVDGSTALDQFEAFESLLDAKPAISKQRKENWTKVLRAVFERSVDSLRANKPNNKRAWNLFLNTVGAFAEEYTKVKAEDKKREAEEAEKLKFKTHEHISVKKTMDDEESFRAMFPDFHKEFNAIPEAVLRQLNGEDEEENEPIVEEDDETRLKGLNQQVFVEIVVEATRTLLQEPNKNISNPLNAFAFAYHAAGCFSQPRIASRIDSSIGGHLMALKLAVEDCSKESSDCSVENSNEDASEDVVPIYTNLNKDSLVSEVTRLEKPLRELSRRLAEIMKEWPENAVLVSVAKLTMRLRELPVSCPLMQALVGVETLLRVGNEWELIAHRGISIDAQMKPLVKLVVRWRKLELRSWPFVLAQREERSNSSTLLWFFDLFQLLTSGTAEALLQDLFKTVDQFARTSTLGTFKTRLDMLKAVRVLLEQTGSCQNLNMLWNIETYYSQWCADVKATLDRERQPIQKRLQDSTKLAKWDDRNYFALKESADRSHRLLHKLSNDFEEILDKPAYPTIEFVLDNLIQSSPTSLVNLTDVTQEPELKSQWQVPIFSTDIQVVDTTPKGYGSRLAHLFQRMNRIATKDVVERVSKWNMNAPCDLNDSIVGRITHLREGKAPQSAKQRGLTDLFDALTAEGIVRPAGKQACFDSFTLFTKESVSDNHGFFKCVAQLHRFQHSIGSGGLNEDVPLNQYQKALQMVEHVFQMVVDQRDFIAGLVRDKSVLADACVSISRASMAVSKVVPEQLERLTTVMGGLCTNLSELSALDFQLAELREPVELKAFLKERGFTATLATFKSTSRLTATVTDYIQFLQNSLVFVKGLKGPWLIEEEMIQLRLILVSLTNNCVSELSSIHFLHFPQKLTAELMLIASEAAATASVVLVEQSPTAEDDQASVQIDSCVESLLVAFQNLRECNTEHSPNSIVEASRAFITLVPAFNLRRVNSELQKLLTILRSTSLPVVQRLSGVLCGLHDISNIFSTLAIYVTENFVEYNGRLVKLEFLLLRVFRTLALNGFCKPEDEDDEAQDDNREGDGTGMGEGKGREDVTDEIEDEEQLLGLQQEASEEQQDKEEKKGDDGLEMENDFDGDLHDVEQDADENKDEEEEEEDDKEELDREMGDLDREQEQVVDEKLWDEEDDEQKDEDEKFEQDAPMKGEDDELRAKDKEDEDKKRNDPEENKTEEEKGEEKEEQVESGDENDFMDDGENLEDRHYDIPEHEEQEPEDLEIPEDSAPVGDEGEEDPNNEEEKEEEEFPGDDQDVPGKEQEEEPEQNDLAEDAITGTAQEENDEDENEEDKPMDENDDGEQQQQIPDNSGENESEQLDRAFGTDAPKAGEEDETAEEQVNEESSEQQKQDSNNEQEKNDTKGQQRGDQQDESNNPEAEWSKDNSNDGGDQQENNNNQGDENSQEEEKPNPWRDPGSATNHWHRRLQMLTEESSKDENPDDDQMQDEPMKDEEDTRDTSPETDQKTYEFSGKNDASTTQVLAPVGEEEQEGALMEEEEQEIDDEGGESKRDRADVDHESDTEQQNDDQPQQPRKKQRMESDKKPQGVKDEQPMERGYDDDAPKKMEIVTSIKHDENLSDEEEDQERIDMEYTAKPVQPADYDRWNRISGESLENSQRLCEQLRLLLEPSLATKLKGDYRTGKRINMRRVIPYIASQFRKDKIWLRRTKPSKREYQIVLAIDDSKSMLQSGELALGALAIITKALSTLEVGQLAIVSFGEQVHTLHSLDQPFTDSSGAEVMSQFLFDQERTAVEDGIRNIISMFNDSKCAATEKSFRQIAFFISDGRFDSAVRDNVQKMIRTAMQNGLLIVLIIVEHPNEESILETKQVSFVKGKVKMSSYLDDYPFPLYVLLQDMQALPEVLADALRQWFEVLAISDN